ncbi:MAG: hypothetical protein P1U41_03795, partial [Vicingaceae bacterium]|nr:hypothetical protein [Vicingaceae bacterium]
MKKLIEDFTKHISKAIAIGNNSTLTPTNKKIENVIICGLGGSGIGGTVVAQVVTQFAKYPITVNKDYKIPAFVNENTLVI